VGFQNCRMKNFSTNFVSKFTTPKSFMIYANGKNRVYLDSWNLIIIDRNGSSIHIAEITICCVAYSTWQSLGSLIIESSFLLQIHSSTLMPVLVVADRYPCSMSGRKFILGSFRVNSWTPQHDRGFSDLLGQNHVLDLKRFQLLSGT